jgi:hypothetical protein
MREQLQRLVAAEHACPHSVGIIDEVGCPKKGDKTPGVQVQWCGASSRKDNCVVTVHLAYAADDFHCLLDNELFLPESWSIDRERCRAAKIPDDMVHRTKHKIALELYDRARSNGVRLEWLTFDELYSNNREFLAGLRQRQQKYVAEVPVTFMGWLQSPEVTNRKYRRRAKCGRVRRTPRCKEYAPAAICVGSLLVSCGVLCSALANVPRERRRERSAIVGDQVSLVLSARWQWSTTGTGASDRGSQPAGSEADQVLRRPCTARYAANRVVIRRLHTLARGTLL